MILRIFRVVIKVLWEI
uniref:Uncharacterized protein n=1 Tax=Rhizophora mucronata TaxID=61149 RepID=A0A2P2PF91_RHIMU